MGFPILIAAIRNSGLPQWRVANLTGLSESRLSRIARRGTATGEERRRLSRLLGVSESALFGPGPRVYLNLGGQRSEGVSEAASEPQAPLTVAGGGL